MSKRKKVDKLDLAKVPRLDEPNKYISSHGYTIYAVCKREKTYQILIRSKSEIAATIAFNAAAAALVEHERI